MMRLTRRDDGRFARQILQVLDVVEVVFLHPFADVVDDLRHGGSAVRVLALEGVFNLGRHPHPHLDVLPGREPQGVDGVGIERIGDRNHQPIISFHQRNDLGLY